MKQEIKSWSSWGELLGQKLAVHMKGPRSLVVESRALELWAGQEINLLFDSGSTDAARLMKLWRIRHYAQRRTMRRWEKVEQLAHGVSKNNAGVETMSFFIMTTQEAAARQYMSMWRRHE